MADASYAAGLAEWEREQRREELERRRSEDEIGQGILDELSEREVSTDPAGYGDVPSSGAYVTVETTKRTGERAYYYGQWREGETWENEYSVPVNPRRARDRVGR